MSSPEIMLRPIGVLRTPYASVADNVPIQGRMAPGTEGRAELYPEYADGCSDLEGFSHVILLYLFHMSTEENLIVKPYMDTATRGVFSTRFPHRPNHIGLTLVELIKVGANILTVRGVDMFDGTPLLDVKPYAPEFDSVERGAGGRTGWMEKYLSGRSTPGLTETGSTEEWLNKADR